MGVPEPRAVEVHRDAGARGGRPQASRIASSGCTVPPPKLWVFSTTTSAVLDLVGPGAGASSAPAGRRGSSSAALASAQVREVMPREHRRARPARRAARAPASRRRAPRRGSTCRRMPSWLAIDPVGENSPASWPSRSATCSSSARTVGSSPKTSSPTSARGHGLAHRRGSARSGCPSRRSATGRARRGVTSCAEHLGDEERQLQALLVVQARVAHRLVALVEVGVEDLLGAAEALGDVVAGELDVDAAGHRAEGAVHLEEAADLVDDVVEVARLVAATPTRRCCRASGRRST